MKKKTTQKSRKVFLSFLGTGNYKECRYSSKNLGESSVVKFVQEAILELIACNWTSSDRAVIFLTDSAEQKNWSELDSRIKDYPFEIATVRVPEGYDENEIWEIFQSVYSTIDQVDQVILDITHGFRSLPMLAMVLLQYAKVLKKINVLGVYYGAFEALGPAFDIEKRIPNPDDRKAPLLDLSAFSDLQDWSAATDNFMEFGNARKLIQRLKKITNTNIHSDDIPPKDQNTIKEFAKRLNNLCEAISTVRGKEIIYGSIATELSKQLIDVEKIVRSIPQLSALSELLLHIDRRINGFERNNTRNGLIAIQWCIDNSLIQQGITLLREFVITILFEKLNENYEEEFLRETLSNYLGMNPKIEFNYDRDEQKKRSQVKLIEKLNKLPQIEDIRKVFSKIAVHYRNDINHAGFVKSPKDSKLFVGSLYECFNKVKNLLDYEIIESA